MARSYKPKAPSRVVRLTCQMCKRELVTRVEIDAPSPMHRCADGTLRSFTVETYDFRDEVVRYGVQSSTQTQTARKATQ